MAYNELIKNFNRIRDYMREFYVYGFKSRDKFTRKSSRSYDDERRRIESWLGDYMSFRQTADGKNVFMSIDSRVSHHNPLYKAFKTKSFTDGDITLHFILMDILSCTEEPLSISEITEKIDEYLCNFSNPRIFDESTVRKKLKEYVTEGIILKEKKGKTLYYSLSEDNVNLDFNVIDFFSEVAPCGVIGSFLLDKCNSHKELFQFKHHYITGAMDSEIMCELFIAMNEKKNATIEILNRHKEKVTESLVVPLRIMISVQNGRQYLMAYSHNFNRITSYRLDNILSVKVNDKCDNFDELRNNLKNMMPKLWGVSSSGKSNQRVESVQFTVYYSDEEEFIHNRLEREKRCGTVERLDNNHSRFSANVYDSSELIPWIRTFICRITDINFSNKELENQFKNDIKEMYKLYGIKEDNNDI